MFRLQLAAVICCSLQLASAAPQFVTFKDGKVGVNFGGYHAEAGLGGLLTGNAAHGGLSASAGTPWGPQAAAGLNGALNGGGRGRAAGSAYAGAQLNSNVGASSVIGGEVGGEQQGFAGAEAHSAGKTVMKKTRDVVAGGGVVGAGEGGAEGRPHEAAPEFNVQTVKTSSVQKIKPHKKYNLLKGEILQSSVNGQHQLSNNNNNGGKNIPASDLGTPTTTTTTSGVSETAAGPAEGQTVAEVITVNRRRQREHKQKLPPQRRLRGRRIHGTQRSKAVVTLYAGTSNVAVAARTEGRGGSADDGDGGVVVVADVDGVKQQHEVAHSKQLIKPAYKEVRLPSGSTVVTQDNSFVHSQQHQQQQQQQHLHQSASPGFETASVGVHASTGLVGNLLNIPIGILKSLQESLSGVDVNKSLSYTKLS